MKTRREAIKLLMALFAGAATFWDLFEKGLRWAYAGVKRTLLPKGTPLRTLVGKNPAQLDTSQLDITPLAEFETMGMTDHSVSAENWRLTVTGAVEHPLTIGYPDLTRRPAVERNVLLICPGFFAYHGRWTGVSVAELLAEAGLHPEAAHVEFSGPTGPRGKSERFSLEAVRSGRVFLAYRVNGEPLPRKHGFPLRLVAEDHYGARWVKYVDTVTVIAD
jgi:DMSO/TMAO reductase YedYZ molybdopterin-dependent catalytic subunit